MNQVYKDPIKEFRLKYDEGVKFLYHFTQFKMKDDDKYKEKLLKTMCEKKSEPKYKKNDEEESD